MLWAQISFGTTKSDSILSLTSGARVKAVWVRCPWCDVNYNHIQAYSNVELESDNPYTQLVVFDTDEGRERYLDSTIGSHASPRITRKGTHVIWNDIVNSRSWIRDFAGTQPKRVFIDGGEFFVAACQGNPVTNTEYVYVQTANMRTYTRVPLKADYTPDWDKKVTLFQSNTASFGPVSSSEDGKYLGTETPWPNTGIWDVATGRLLARHVSGDAFGCQPNIAPDNSYRFFYLSDDHRVIRMWDAKLSENYWSVTINANMPGNTKNHDCHSPRWTNNIRFFTNSFPLTTGFVPHWGKARIFSMSAMEVKSTDPSNAEHFCLGKFSQDFKAVEAYVLITGGDIRRHDAVGDAWIAGSVDGTAPSAVC